MNYRGIRSTEYADIRRLNVAFLERRLTDTASFATITGSFSPAVQGAWEQPDLFASLPELAMPYLLFEVGPVIESPGPVTTAPLAFVDPDNELALLALGLMQRLGRRERYALRVCTGLSSAAAGRLVETDLVDLARDLKRSAHPLRPVLAHLPFFWPGLVTAAEAGNRSRLAALLSLGHQHLLCSPSAAALVGRHQRAARTAPRPLSRAAVRP